VIRSVPRTWLVLDIVGSVLGLLITLPISLMMSAGSTSMWLQPEWLALGVTAIVGAAMWGAAAIARLSPAIALGAAWAAAILQMACGFSPALYDAAIFVVLFATSAWGSRRVLWWGGGSVVGGGVIAGVYIALQQLGALSGQGIASTVRSVSVTAALAITSIVFALVIAWGAGLLWRVIAHGRQTREAQLQAEAAAAEEAERVRIARDMHDIVAHSLAVVIAQADGARYAAKAQPELAEEAMVTIAQTARAALSDVRMLLTQLRHRQGDGPQPTLADLESLFTHVRQAGVEPRVTVDPMPPGEPPAGIQLAVYRILQEALTNALRHGEGDVDVHLAWLPDRVEIRVRNRIAAEKAGPGGGHGLVGMRERAQLAGGALTAGAEGTWFAVHAVLPIGASAARP
jgi:signal transduction histidine kinase